ncbi:hypothetical protein [Lonsdalea britannica]|nr:hypothetical protein [Lonsdalea britannica]
MVLAKLPEEERQRICAVLRSVLPSAESDDLTDPPGRAISFTTAFIFSGVSQTAATHPFKSGGFPNGMRRNWMLCGGTHSQRRDVCGDGSIRRIGQNRLVAE